MTSAAWVGVAKTPPSTSKGTNVWPRLRSMASTMKSAASRKSSTGERIQETGATVDSGQRPAIALAPNKSGSWKVTIVLKAAPADG